MNGCPTHGPLLGGYVLGALEPGEMEEMRRHAAACPHCGPQARAMSDLPQLLDLVEPGDLPPPALPARVEEAVLDRFARERRPARVRRPPRGRPRVGHRAAAVAAA
ncbi:MAG: anti-sigma factor family protein, partial [Thermoleophilaceae bacterium]